MQSDWNETLCPRNSGCVVQSRILVQETLDVSVGPPPPHEWRNFSRLSFDSRVTGEMERDRESHLLGYRSFAGTDWPWLSYWKFWRSSRFLRVYISSQPQPWILKIALCSCSDEALRSEFWRYAWLRDEECRDSWEPHGREVTERSRSHASQK